jgi:hypothetical protein
MPERLEAAFNGIDLSEWQVWFQKILQQYWKVENSVIVVNTNGVDHICMACKRISD